MVKKALVILALVVAALVSVGYLQRGTTSRALNVVASSAPGGKIAFAADGSIWMYAEGKTQQLTAGPKDKHDKRDAQPSFSPDGSQIVYTRFDEGFSDIYKLDVSTPARTIALTNHKPDAETGGAGYATQALWAMQPAWSPNGERIAYTSDVHTEYPGLFSMDTIGESARKLEYLDHSMQTVEHPSWSPDGRKIAVANYVTKNSTGQIWVLDTASGKWTELTDAKDGAYDPAWSPDGEWIAFTMRTGTSSNIYMVPTDAQKWISAYPTPVQLTTDGASRAPAWSPDGNQLAWISLKDISFDLYAAPILLDTTSNPTLQDSQKLTDKANIDATSGLSWGK